MRAWPLPAAKASAATSNAGSEPSQAEPDPAAATAAGSSGEPLTPEQAGSLLITRLWQALPAGVLPTRLVLTAPIEGYRGYRQWLQQLSSQIPVEEVALVDEPTAAAIGAGLPAGSRVLVVDLGGGTIDLSLVALQGGEGRAAPIAQLLRFGGRELDGGRQALRCAEVIGKAGCRPRRPRHRPLDRREPRPGPGGLTPACWRSASGSSAA